MSGDVNCYTHVMQAITGYTLHITCYTCHFANGEYNMKHVIVSKTRLGMGRNMFSYKTLMTQTLIHSLSMNKFPPM